MILILLVNEEVEGVLPISPPLQTLDEEAIDGDIPVAKNDHDTPKVSKHSMTLKIRFPR